MMMVLEAKMGVAEKMMIVVVIRAAASLERHAF